MTIEAGKWRITMKEKASKRYNERRYEIMNERMNNEQ